MTADDWLTYAIEASEYTNREALDLIHVRSALGALAREVLRLRSEQARVREAVEEALRLYRAGYRLGDVLASALVPEPAHDRG